MNDDGNDDNDNNENDNDDNTPCIFIYDPISPAIGTRGPWIMGKVKRKEKSLPMFVFVPTHTYNLIDFDDGT